MLSKFFIIRNIIFIIQILSLFYFYLGYFSYFGLHYFEITSYLYFKIKKLISIFVVFYILGALIATNKYNEIYQTLFINMAWNIIIEGLFD
jgi:hypothetical protein